MRPQRRVENYTHNDEAIGEVPSEFEESGNGTGLVDTIRSVNDALETGRQAMETLQNVIENIRGN